MTELECKQAYANMSAAQLLPHLHKAEAALNEVWDAWSTHHNLTEQRTRTVEDLTVKKSTAPIKTVITIVMSAAAVLFFILSAQKRNLAAFLLKLPAFFCLIFAVVAFFTLLPEWKALKKLKAEVTRLDAELAKAAATLEEAKEKNNYWLVIQTWVCPEECSNPQHMRAFVSFFEDSRASNMKEARNLFDQYIHRVHLETTANSQLAAARMAAIRAEEARTAAENAAITARQAKNSADWAAYQTRNK